ncbi:MAG TPA: hypothetical protein VLJ83_08110 [Gemmatimonadaceae bacterium]|nr:hypothetical protein [Gemmatimonadaceae bacterium]
MPSQEESRQSGFGIVPDELCNELYIAVENAAIRSAGSINALRLAVKRFTVAMRDDGAKPETVLIAIKTLINSRAFPVVEYTKQDWNVDELQQQISTWSIQDFFGDTQS